jgi:hypothetical protein
MKKNLFKALIMSSMFASVTFFAACDEDAGITIDVPQDIDAFYKIPPLSTTTLSRVDTIESNLDSLLTANNASREDITQIVLSGLKLTITDVNGVTQPSQNFNNIKNIGVSIAELTGNFSAIQAIDSATMFTSYRNINPIIFPTLTENVDLLPFVVKPSFRTSLEGRLYNPTTDTMYVKSTMTLLVGVSL